MVFGILVEKMGLSVAEVSREIGRDCTYISHRIAKGDVSETEEAEYCIAVINAVLRQRLQSSEEAMRDVLLSLNGEELADAARCVSRLNEGKALEPKTRAVELVLPILRRVYDPRRHVFRI